MPPAGHSLNLAALSIVMVLGAGQAVRAEVARAEQGERDSHALRAIAERIPALRTPKRATAAGDWLEGHPEAGQSFAQYVAQHPRRSDARLTTIYILPIGEFSTAQDHVVEQAGQLLKEFYGLQVRKLAPLAVGDIPAGARRNDKSVGHEQLLTTFLLQKALPPRRPADAVAVLGLTSVDLWPGPGWNFVFGQADLTTRVGVYSLARYGNPAASDQQYQLCLRRTLKVAVHETGHMLGIPHCTAYECGMNGSNSLDELDRNQLGFCAECEPKIWWTCRLDPGRRYQALAQFAREHQLADEEQLWQRCVDALPATR